MAWRAVVAGLEAATAACAGLNCAYFLNRLILGHERFLSRRVAAFVLALISFAVLIESAFILTSLADGRDVTVFASSGWRSVRIVAFLGTACMSALVVRAMGRGR